MPGVHERDVQKIGRAAPDVPGIGIVTVDHVGDAARRTNEVEQVVHEAIEVIP